MARPDGKRLQIDPLGVDVLREGPGRQGQGADGAHRVDALLRQHADLTVPVPRVGVALDAVIPDQAYQGNLALPRSLRRADVYARHAGHAVPSLIQGSPPAR